MKNTLKISPVGAHTGPIDLERLFTIMLNAYAVTEVRIWGEGYQRMIREDFETVVEKREFIGAWIGEKPVGSIHVYRVSENAFAFGLLSVDFNFKGLGIGRELIQAAEEKARKEGAEFMELEILRPENEIVEAKQVLHDWYTRLGYQLTRTVSFIERKPDRQEYLDRFIQPCVFDCYQKRLSAL